MMTFYQYGWIQVTQPNQYEVNGTIEQYEEEFGYFRKPDRSMTWMPSTSIQTIFDAAHDYWATRRWD